MTSPIARHSLPLTTPELPPPDAPWYRKSWVWITAPLVDGQEGLSLTRFLAIYFAYLCGQSVQLSNGRISINALWLALAAAAIAFGKSTFSFLLRRLEMRSLLSRSEEDSEQRVTINSTQRVIQDRRDASAGIEPAP